jgi:DnaK suppressor protein
MKSPITITPATMTPEMIRSFRNRFENARSSMTFTSLGLTNDSFHMSSEETKDETDLSASMTEQSMRLRLRNREALFMKKIDEALERIHAGTFGECDDCGESIDPRRLDARPTTALCVACKEESERLEAIHIDGRRSKSAGRAMRFG